MENRFIGKLRGFAKLDHDDVAALVQATANGRNVPRKTDLIREGDRPGPVFVILEGWAIRYKILPAGTRQVLAFLMPGDACDLHVGYLAEMDHGIQTIGPAVVATIDRTDMEELLDRRREVARAMYTSQLVDEGTMRAWITSMGRRTSTERVAHLMCELYLRARNIGLPSEDKLVLPLSQILLADAVGMTAVHLNRVLKELRKLEIMRLEGGHLVIADPIRLANVAGFDENYLHRRMRASA